MTVRSLRTPRNDSIRLGGDENVTGETVLPDPLVPGDLDVRDLDGFMLNVERLLASELVAIYSADECWAAVMLWCRAWKQLPGGSLPDDDRILASFSGAGKRWGRVREAALHGFIKCSDGRLYHRFLCSEALVAYARKLKFQAHREADRKRLADWRAKHLRNEDGNEFETRFVRDENAFRTVRTGTGTGTGTGTKGRKKEDTSPDGDVVDSALEHASGENGDARKRGTRLPDDWRPGPAEWDFAEGLGLDPEAVTEEFRDYWAGIPGAKGRKLDWPGTFRNRCRELAGRQQFRRSRGGSSRSGGIVSGFGAARLPGEVD